MRTRWNFRILACCMGLALTVAALSTAGCAQDAEGSADRPIRFVQLAIISQGQPYRVRLAVQSRRPVSLRQRFREIEGQPRMEGTAEVVSYDATSAEVHFKVMLFSGSEPKGGIDRTLRISRDRPLSAEMYPGIRFEALVED